jgi:uncharacterized protein (DUF2141 family)
MGLVLVNCAKRGSPNGGAMDSLPPVFIKANPPNFTTNFDDTEIKIYFDEYVKLKDYQKQLIISPPLTNSIISPQGSAAKYITIDIKDTLQPNTTYVFNFGQSIVDNNESNPYAYFKYILSTGDYIDSLSVKGDIVDALERIPDNFVTVMLYEADSTYNDSIVYKDPPRYVTNTLDSLTSFEIGNLKEGTYKLVAMKDEDANFTFQPKKDKIAFYEAFITVPKDTSYRLKLFSESVPVKVSRPRHAGAQRINFGVQGSLDSLSIRTISEVPSNFESLLTIAKKDTLSFLYKPKVTADSLVFALTSLNYQDTLVAKLRQLKEDTLIFKSYSGSSLILNTPFEISSSIPIIHIDTTKINIIADSTMVPFTTAMDPRKGRFSLKFDTKEETKYSLTFLPEAVTDYFGNTHDTLTFTTKTKEFSDYGDIELTLLNAKKYPYIVQLMTEKGDIQEERYATDETVLTFKTLKPAKFYIRLIEDNNKNGVYDSGNFLEQRQPERVIYYPEIIDLNAGWFPKLIFELKD